MAAPPGFRPLKTKESPKGFVPLPKEEQADTQDVEQPGMMETAGGLGEVGLTFLTGSIAEPVSGLAGVGQLVFDAIRGDNDPLSSASQRIEKVRESLTRQPQTEVGQDAMRMVSYPFQKLAEGAQKAGESVFEATGSPEAGAAVESSIELAPGLVGIRRPRVGFKQRREDVKRVEEGAERTGVELDQPGRQVDQIVDAARRETGDFEFKGQALDQVQSAIQNAKQAEKQAVSALYEQARATKAGVPVSEVRPFIPMMRESVKNFDVDDMPIVKRRLDEIEKIRDLPDGSSVRLDKIEQFRQRINKNRAASTDLSQNAALGALKAQVDNFIDAQFNADMISGDPTAIAKWKGARDAYREYKKRFSENRTIKQLAEMEATPEEMRQWIFNSSVVGAKKQAGDTVSRIKKIVGEDSPQFQALRQDALLDIMEPLLREEPNLKAFAQNYDKLVKNNRSVVNELFPDSKTPLKELRDIAASVQKRIGDKRPNVVDLNRMGAVALFGHGIAKSAMKVRLAQQALQLLMTGASKSAKNQIMSDILGYNPKAPLLPASPVVIGGAVQTGMGEEANENSE